MRRTSQMDGYAYGAQSVGRILIVIGRCRCDRFVRCDVEGRGRRCDRTRIRISNVNVPEGESELHDQRKQRRLGPKNAM